MLHEKDKKREMNAFRKLYSLSLYYHQGHHQVYGREREIQHNSRETEQLNQQEKKSIKLNNLWGYERELEREKEHE